MAEKSRSLAKIAHNIIGPYPDQSILDFYKGDFDCVYIMLHPFSKIKQSDKINFYTQSAPTEEDYFEYTEKISWTEFIKISGIIDINKLDIALRNLIGGLIEKHKNDYDLKLLKDNIKTGNIVEPGEDDFSDLLIDDMLKALIDLGHEWVYIGDEFGFERRIEFIRDIIDNKSALNMAHPVLYTTMNEVLYATHWDSHFTILCSDEATVKKIVEKYAFEGFFCRPETRVYWSIHNGC